jgi:kinetochore protein NDC80
MSGLADVRFKELRHKTLLLQDTVVTQMVAHIDVVIQAKDHTSKALKGVRTYAETQ